MRNIIVFYVLMTMVFFLCTRTLAQPNAGFTPEYGIVTTDCKAGFYAHPDCSLRMIDEILMEGEIVPILGIRQCNCGTSDAPKKCWLAEVYIKGSRYFTQGENVTPENPDGWALFKAMDKQAHDAFYDNTFDYLFWLEKAEKKRADDSLFLISNSNLILLNWSCFREEGNPDSLSVKILLLNPTYETANGITFYFKGYNAKEICLADTGNPVTTLKYPGTISIGPGQAFEINFPKIFPARKFSNVELKKIEVQYDMGAVKILVCK